MTLTSSSVTNFLPWQNPHLLQTESDYQQAIAAIADLMHVELTSRQSDLLDLLVALVEKYEDDNYQLPESSPLSMLEFLMETTSSQTGRSYRCCGNEWDSLRSNKW